MAQRNSGYERKPRDLYETPEWVSLALKPYIPKNAIIWEPACASGKMARALGASFATDLVTDYGQEGVDFLARNNLPGKTTAIITNPPFNREAEKFIRHGINLLSHTRNGFMAMLLPVAFDSAKTRGDMFGKCAYFASKLVLTSRIVWFENTESSSGPSENHAWFLWRFNHPSNTELPTIDYHFSSRKDK